MIIDDKEIIRERLAKTREKNPLYSGIVLRSIRPDHPCDSNNYAVFGTVISSRKGYKRLTLEDIISCVRLYIDKYNSDEAIILLQYRHAKGMILKYWHTEQGEDEFYLIGELEKNQNTYSRLL